MAENDFHAYTSNASAGTSNIQYHQRQVDHKPIHYVLEKRDGSLLHQTLDLSGSVESILSSLASALESSGAARMAPPPSVGPVPQSSSSSTNGDNIHWVKYSSTNETTGDGSSDQGSFIDDRYDINTNRGRDLLAFLNSVTPQQIEERRARRMDASAAALVTRRLFSFQSVDGTRLGWSSESFAVLLTSLIRLHDEHSSKFHVSSFYPLRLVFSPDDGRRYEPLDVYGGNLFLNPAATHLEWLEALREVTTDQLDVFEKNRQVTQERARMLEDKLGIKVKRGLSCSSLEYFFFLKRVVEPYESTAGVIAAASTAVATTAPHAKQLVPVTSALETERLRLVVVVETPAACRRAKVTTEGTIRLPADTSSAELDVAISRLSKSALERWEMDKLQQEECQQLARQIQWELGLEKAVRMRGVVRNHEFVDALSRMLDLRSTLRSHLSGYSLEIAGRGHQCSVADDGCLVVPHNWK